MKKVLPLLFLSILFIQCSTNDETEELEPQERLEDLAISITIEGNLLNENREKILYIGSEEGMIEGKISLQNNQKNILTIQRELNTKYYVIIHDKVTFDGRTRHDFDIFENLKSSDYIIKGHSGGTSSELPEVDLYIVNTGDLEPIGRTGGGQSSWSSANGGYFTSKGKSLTNPGDYYSSFKKQDEPFGRYFWTENIEEDKTFDLNYEELPIAPLVETQLPQHVSATIFVHGYRSEHPSAGHNLSRGSTQGFQIFETYFPEEHVFDYVRFSGSFFDGSKSYSINSVSEDIPSRIQVPSFDMTINNLSIDNTNYTTTGNYDYSTATFVISEDNIYIQAIVKVFSEQRSTVSFSISTLVNSLFEELPSLDAAQLAPNNVILSSYNNRENYEEAIEGIIESDSSRLPGYLGETVSRRDQ